MEADQMFNARMKPNIKNILCFWLTSVPENFLSLIRFFIGSSEVFVLQFSVRFQCFTKKTAPSLL